MKAFGSPRAVASRVLATLPPSFLAALAGVRLIVPYYHMVSDEQVPHVRHLYPYKSVSSFRRDLEFILKHYSPIALGDLLDHVKGGRRLPSKSVLLTFDDGFREMSETVAPLLLAKGVSATFFVNSAFIGNRHMCYLNKASVLVDEILRKACRSVNDRVTLALRSNGINSRDPQSAILSLTYRQRHLVDELGEVVGLNFAEYLELKQPYLTAGQIERLVRDGFAIGAHSVDHPLYAELPFEEQLLQTLASLRSIRQTFGLTYGAFAFPHSDRHVSRYFFETVAESGLLDVSFGTAGMVADSVANHFHRFSLEAPLEAAGRIVAFQLARRVAKQLSGNVTIQRQ
jgi:peptidoglycan/xylan/chitin deacetylase (PgdA/CDA1 family)